MAYEKVFTSEKAVNYRIADKQKNSRVLHTPIIASNNSCLSA